MTVHAWGTKEWKRGFGFLFQLNKSARMLEAHRLSLKLEGAGCSEATMLHAPNMAIRMPECAGILSL